VKKAIMSKRGRRFDEGGFVNSETQNVPRARTAAEDQDAADKAAGLAASKDDSVGFFERMRMGNIDDPSSEAYRRFGAGRGRASRIPVEDVTPTPVETSRITSRSEGMGGVNAAIQARKNAEAEGEKISEGERIAQAMASKPDRAPMKATSKPVTTSKTTVVEKEAIEKPAEKKAPVVEKTEVKTTTGPKKEMYRTLSGKMAEKTPDYGNPLMGLGETVSRGAKAVGDVFSKYKFMTPAERKSEENRKAKEARGYKAGGSVGKASSRADGIAQRGKTRGVMR
jgi:hypothetical protein